MLHKITFSLLFLALNFLNIIQARDYNNIPTICATLPNPISPQTCCEYPELFKDNVIDYCSNKSTSNKKDQCYYDCVFTATEICRKNKCSYNKAEDYIDWVMKPENIFNNIYKRAYKKCIAQANAMRDMVERLLSKGNECDPLPELIYLCVQNEMFTSCPIEHWKNDNVADCASKRSFIENCVSDD